jgi:hypothetical protein
MESTVNQNEIKVGTIAVTQNARQFPLLSDGHLVVVVGIYSTRAEPYLIRKVNGEPFVVCRLGGIAKFGRFEQLWCLRENLRVEDLDAPGWNDWEAIEQLKIQRLIERA